MRSRRAGEFMRGLLGDGAGARFKRERWRKGCDHGTRGDRLYDLAIRCRGGAGRARDRRAAARGLRQHPARPDLALLVAGRNRARRGAVMIIKTRAPLSESLRAAAIALHSYTTPAIP